MRQHVLLPQKNYTKTALRYFTWESIPTSSTHSCQSSQYKSLPQLPTSCFGVSSKLSDDLMMTKESFLYVIRHIKIIPEQAAVSPMQTLLFFLFFDLKPWEASKNGCVIFGALWPWPPTWTECSKLRIKHLIPPTSLSRLPSDVEQVREQCNSRSDALVSEQYGESSKVGEIILASTADVCRGIGRERPCGYDTACRGGHMLPFSLPTLVLRPCREHLSSHCHLLFVSASVRFRNTWADAVAQFTTNVTCRLSPFTSLALYDRRVLCCVAFRRPLTWKK